MENINYKDILREAIYGTIKHQDVMENEEDAAGKHVKNLPVEETTSPQHLSEAVTYHGKAIYTDDDAIVLGDKTIGHFEPDAEAYVDDDLVAEAGEDPTDPALHAALLSYFDQDYVKEHVGEVTLRESATSTAPAHDKGFPATAKKVETNTEDFVNEGEKDLKSNASNGTAFRIAEAAFAALNK